MKTLVLYIRAVQLGGLLTSISGVSAVTIHTPEIPAKAHTRNRISMIAGSAVLAYEKRLN